MQPTYTAEEYRKALELACDKQMDCPETDGLEDIPWSCKERHKPTTSQTECWKEYFLSKAGDSTP